MCTKFTLNIQKRDKNTYIFTLPLVSKLDDPKKKMKKCHIFSEYRNDIKLIMFHISTTSIMYMLSKGKG